MTQEIEPSENTMPKAPEDKPILPDGIGLSLEQAKALIAKDNGVVLSSDEPALMGITICNAYLIEVQKLHERHSKGLAKLMAEKTDAYVSGVNTAIAQLSESLSAASVEGIRKIFDDHAARLHAFKNTATWATAIIAVSALFNVAVFILRGLR
ncbi:MAG: hypothetical protein ZNDK_1129 [Candidatus Desulfovibrio kirbyi]|jgi:hypothetical protein|uniref:Uncharacterized protein n=1 Tax=Candidatus Desulfovibrio kirbyi TaxID=2696086 RepID=A0A6L2R6Y6_9BACT|nr:MAG: hypothetical protein ZNDK_1129 [Candidatus Desulfovibrio kirbyi]